MGVALKEGHCIASSLPRGSWYISCGGVRRFLGLFATHLYKHAGSKHSTIMSSVTPPQRSDNDGPQPHLVITANHAGIYSLAYFPDGRRVVVGSSTGAVRVWNLEDGKQEGTSMKHHSGIYGLTVTRDGTKIICSYKDGVIKVWNVASHEIVKKWSHPGSCPIVAISPDDQLIAAGDKNVDIYSMERRQVKHSIEVGNRVRSLCFSPDGKKLVCGTDDDIRVYDVEGSTLILGPLRGHQDWVRCVLWSRDGSRLFSGSKDKTIRCWNSDTGEQIGQPWAVHRDSMRSLSLSPDGSIIASASRDKTVRFWDATTGSPIRQHLEHDNVTAVRFSPSGESMASAGWDGKIYIWRAPWLDSVENRVRTLTKLGRISAFIIITLST